MARRGHRQAVGATAVALACVVSGSWLVVSGATASPAPAAASPAPRPRPTTAPEATAPRAGHVAAATNPARAPTAPWTPPASASRSPSSGPATMPRAGTTPTTMAAARAPVPLAAHVRGAAAGARRVAHGVSAPRGTNAEAAAAVGIIRAVDALVPPRGAVPVTSDNVTLLERWIANEGGLWAHNPLNTSLYAGAFPHEITVGGQDTGDPIFPTLAVGMAATAQTLLSSPAYTRILALLRTGHASCLRFARAVIHSPWASSHYGHDTARFCGGAAPSPRHTRHARPARHHR